MRPELLNRLFRKLQLFSSGFLAFSHGSNDAQKTMGIITLSLMTFGVLQNKTFEIPVWVICACAMTLSLGTMTGGWKIIRTMSSKVIKMKPIHGFSVEIASASIITAASHFGFPVSTTHIISTGQTCSIPRMRPRGIRRIRPISASITTRFRSQASRRT